jgi:anaerobic carbon-monoxide dehydrogenase iron sulfur subunit
MEEEKVIIYDPVYCSGCMRCMTACSTYNNGATSLSKSRLQIVRHEGHAISRMTEEDDLIFDVLTCQQCDQPACVYFCPTLSIRKNNETGCVTINHDTCVGCRMCMVSCPFGAISYDGDRRSLIKCELCAGDPQCVRFCPTGALKFLPKKEAHLPKRNHLARNLIQNRTRAMRDTATSGEGDHAGS